MLARVSEVADHAAEALRGNAADAEGRAFVHQEGIEDPLGYMEDIL